MIVLLNKHMVNFCKSIKYLFKVNQTTQKYHPHLLLFFFELFIIEIQMVSTSIVAAGRHLQRRDLAEARQEFGPRSSQPFCLQASL